MQTFLDRPNLDTQLDQVGHHRLEHLVQPTLPSEHIHGPQAADIPHHHGALVIVPLLPDEGSEELE